MKNNLQNYGQRWGVKQVVATALALLLVLFLLPLLLFGTGGLEQAEQAAPTGELPIDRTVVTPSPSADSQTRIRVALTDGSVLTLGLDQYLWRVVAAEMPASFELEALKAQAAAARTYTLSKLGRAVEKHPDADVCTDITCCQAYIDPDQAAANWGDSAAEYTAKITSAVSETDGMAVLYGGQPIQAVFFSSAAGRTVDAVEVWGNSVDYLKSVDSPEGEEVPNYRTQVTLSADQVKELTLAAYPGADLSGDPAGWFGQASRNEGGGVISIPLGGVTLTGGQARALFSLRSACFTVSWDGEAFTFDVTGYGHGVGMSQYGANAMAREGSGFRDILTWYYTGAEVGPLW